MTLTGILVLLLIAGIVGALGQSISGYSFGGCLMSIIVGFVGAYVGVWLAGQLGLPEVFTINVIGMGTDGILKAKVEDRRWSKFLGGRAQIL